VRLLFGSFFTFALAAFVGLGATWMTLTRGVAFGALSIGDWTAWPKNGSTDIDPYALATIARSGELPVGTGDGVAFNARTDGTGKVFDGRCDYVISGMTPQARYWTVTLYDSDGRLIANSIGRYGFTSQEIARQPNGRFEIVISPRVRPGNWLPTGGIDRFLLIWRLYDTPIGVATRTTKEGPMPAVVRKGCS
jgi:hypothetical protein